MSDRSCSVNGTFFHSPDFGVMSECVPLNRCPTILNNPQAPIMETFPCGFDENSRLLMICCPPGLVRAPLNFTQPPLFPTPHGEARGVEDKTRLCGKWRYEGGACNLDRDFSTSDEGKDPDIGRVSSREKQIRECGQDGERNNKFELYKRTLYLQSCVCPKKNAQVSWQKRKNSKSWTETLLNERSC